METPEPNSGKPKRTQAERRASAEKARLERQRLERDVLALRLAGRSFEQIADDLGFKTKSAAWKVYRKVMDRTVQAPADELRALSEARYEQLRFKHWERALGGAEKATEIVLKIERALADLRGLSAPKEIDLRIEAKEIAERYGLDVDEMVAEAERWIKEKA